MHRPADAVPNKQLRYSDRFDLNHRAQGHVCPGGGCFQFQPNAGLLDAREDERNAIEQTQVDPLTADPCLVEWHDRTDRVREQRDCL